MPGRAQKLLLWDRLGPGNTNVAVRALGAGLVPGIVPSRTHPVYHPPSTQPGTHPPYTPAGPPVLQCGPDETCSLGRTKEILGVDNAHPDTVHARPPHASPNARLPQSPSWSLGRAVRLWSGFPRAGLRLSYTAVRLIIRYSKPAADRTAVVPYSTADWLIIYICYIQGPGRLWRPARCKVQLQDQ